MPFSMNVTGSEGIKGDFDHYNDLAVERVQEIIEQAAVVIMGAAKEYCPVDTGRLQGSIQAQSLENTSTGAIATIGPNTDYESYVEFGTYKQVAQPYMRPAALDGEAFIEQQEVIS